MATSYRFLRTPRWIVLTVVVALLVVVMVNLGLWQLRRWDERKSLNQAVASREEAAPVPLDQAVPPGATTIGDAQWDQVQVSGRYDPGEQVLVRNRSYEGTPGYHVVTPLVLADGTAVLVNRGWVPLPPTRDAAVDAPAPASGEVTVLARVRPTQTRGAFGPRDPTEGDLSEVARVDVARIQQQVPYGLRAGYLELEQQQPAAGDLPRPVPAPDTTDEGPHLAYAGQWFLFSILAVVGWVVLVRATARGRSKGKRRRRAVTPPPPAPGEAAAEVPTGTTEVPARVATAVPTADADPGGPAA